MEDSTTKHCGKCDRPDSADHLVGCDSCDTWVHFDCAGVTDSIADPDRTWKCDRCRLREDDAISQSRKSVGRSSTSKRSTRVELSLQMMEEQKAMRMKRIMEEQAAQAAARQMLAEEEEKFLKQKYDLLMAEADCTEDGASRRTRLSSRASREKVRSWLSEHQGGVVLQVAAVPASSVLPSVGTSEAAHQSSCPRPSLPIAASTMMDSAIMASEMWEPTSTAITTASQDPPPKYSSGKVVSSTEITFERRPVSTSKTSRCGSVLDIDSVGMLVPKTIPTTENKVDPSVPSFPTFNLNPVSTVKGVSPMASGIIPVGVSKTSVPCKTVDSRSAAGGPTSAVSKTTLISASCVDFSRTPVIAHFGVPTPTLPTVVTSSNRSVRYSVLGTGVSNSMAVSTALLDPTQITSIAGDISALRIPATRSLTESNNPFPTGALGSILNTSVSTITNTTSSTSARGIPAESTIPPWANRNPISSSSQGDRLYAAGGDPSGINSSLQSTHNIPWTNRNPVYSSTQAELMCAASGGGPVGTNSSVPSAHNAAPHLFDAPRAVESNITQQPILQGTGANWTTGGSNITQPAGISRYFRNHTGEPISQAHPSAVPMRSMGPSAEQLAARQVMPRELPDFSGDPQEWPLFYSSFCNSTEACGYTDSENLARLQRCLKGNALEAVRSRLLMPQSVPSVIDTLRRLYGRPEILIHYLLQKLRTVPSPKADNLQSVITFGLAVQNAVDHMFVANLNDHLWNPTLLHELVEKLPPQLKMEWSCFKRSSPHVNLATFSAFMSELVVMASDVTLPLDTIGAKDKSNKGGREKQKLYVHSEEMQSEKAEVVEKKPPSEPAKKTCTYCTSASHEIMNCAQFKALDLDGRWKAVKEKNLCRNCLVPHRKWPCRSNKECSVDGCRVHHSELLHSPRNHTHNRAESTNTSQSSSSSKDVVHQNLHSSVAYSLFRYLPVTIHGNGQQIKTFAFLDDGSSSTLLESGIASALGIAGPTDNFCLSWTGNISREEKGSQRVSVIISGDRQKYRLNNVRTVQELRLPSQTMQYEELQQTYPHLKGLPVRSYTGATPGIIIGLEHVRLLTSLRVREGGDNEPVAVKTRLGWCIFGKNSDNGTVLEHLNLHLVGDLENRELHDWMKQYFAVEESSVTVKPEAEEDKRARRIMETTTRRVDGRFETGLLWKYDHFTFPDSYPMAVRRMLALEKRLSRDQVLEAKVKETIAQYEAKGYAHRITPEELQSTNPSKVWYLPLGVVQTPKKPGKIRLIWDAKARAGGVSFNDMLIKGPDLLVALFSVLLHFRQRNVAVVGDIREMFHQILIRYLDKQSQRFLFRLFPELSPQIYVMDVASFGATCSPSLAQFVKNKNAEEFAGSFPRAAKAIVENHYVDDFLDSVDTEAEAVQLVNDVKYVHSQAGFEIRNFCSNSAEVLAEIGEQRAPLTVSMNLEKSLDTERVLGMVWKPTEDVFTFDPSTMKDEVKELVGGSTTPTKRQVLKTVMSLFDPLGLIAQFVVHGKILMQLIWRSGTDWDERISEELREKWDNWCRYMQRLEDVAVPRCFFKGVHSSALSDLEVHVFVDASELACAAVLYLRFGDNGTPRCALVAAKTKVAPLKPLSVPRLELQAAMIGTRLLDSVLTSLDLQVAKRFLWSDSSTVLSWLRSDSRRYHQFVAFRVGEILTSTSVDEWNYVPSKLNVADTATKWKDGPSFDCKDPWYSAPDFLYKSPEHWPTKSSQSESETVAELRAAFLFHGTVQQPMIDVSRFSNWNRLLRAAAYFLRSVRRFKGEKLPHPTVLTQEELKGAENLLWRQIQAEAYPDEVVILNRNVTYPEDPVQIPKASPIYRLSPLIDECGVIRMNSRITAAPAVSMEVKYPILLPKKHHVTHLLVEQYHRRFLHGNRETVCNEMRQRFYISGLRGLIQQISRRCLLCRIRKAVPQPPMMAPLPEARLTGFVKPFTHTGVDYFGPLMVKQGRSLVKRWVALFTCLTVRAVHLEIVHSLSTQSCVMAIRRFVARRGSPESFYSDNGTNFLGASNLLDKQIQDIHEDCALTFTNVNTRWYFNPPSAPHMGGSWERMVRSVKTAMSAIADHPHHPSDEILETVVLEAEAIVNSRPLTYIPLEFPEQEALTPNHFLLFGTKGVVQPEVAINTGGSTLRDSWRLAQSLINHFWTRWIREYLPTIARRTKWFEPTKPLAPGDLVLLVEEGKRNGWLRGQVVDVIKAADGQVRRAVVQTKNGLMTRPAIKLAPLDLRTSGDGPELHGQGDVTNHCADSCRSEFSTARSCQRE